MMAAPDLIELRSISRVYRAGETDVPVLDDVSISISRGEFAAIMGASGSGKSTLMNIIGCLDRPTSGEYFLDGRELGRLSSNDRARARNQTLGFVFQNFNLLPRMSALDNVLMPLSYSSNDMSESEAKERAEGLLRRVGLEDRMSHEPSQLSGGQQQRVAIARALINTPEILLADEPTGNLDSHTSMEMLEMFRKLNEEDGVTVLLVTHDQGVAGVARKIIHILDGKVT